MFYFGHGLSYSVFAYSKLEVAGGGSGTNVTVTVTVANVGSGPDARAGTETVQLYLGVPAVPGLATPGQSLQGFAKVSIAAGGSSTLTFALTRRQISTVAEDGTRGVTPGTYTVTVGGSQPGDPRAPAKGVVGTFTI